MPALTTHALAWAATACAVTASASAVAVPTATAAGSGAAGLTGGVPTATPVVRTLRPGNHGRAVRRLQRRLDRVGISTTVDGDYGSLTARSVRRFERREHLRATGIADAAVQRDLDAELTTATSSAAAGATATINSNGTLTLPAGAPTEVQQIVAAANRIIDTRYVWGGGHASFDSAGYDCSGAVSYALHGAGLLTSPEVSGTLESFGDPGPGAWVTVYANAEHTFLVVAGRAFDTADFGGPNLPAGTGPRWRTDPTGNLADGMHYVVRHPAGL